MNDYCGVLWFKFECIAQASVYVGCSCSRQQKEVEYTKENSQDLNIADVA